MTLDRLPRICWITEDICRITEHCISSFVSAIFAELTNILKIRPYKVLYQLVAY